MDDSERLAKLIDALRPWADQLVIVGGWAHQLYRLHTLAHVPNYEPLRTRDADIAFGTGDVLEGDIGAALRNADFHEVLSGDHVPPVSEFRLGDDDTGFYAEFLAPLIGGATKRDGRADATVAKAGVTAQKLRHLDVLLIAPWTLRLDSSHGFPLSQSADVQVPNPVAFIAQKTLIRRHRKPAKQAQDVLYVHDTLELFGGALDILRDQWLATVKPHIHPTTAATIVRHAREQFAAVDDVIRSATQMAHSRSLKPEQIQKACAYGTAEIFGR